MPGNPGKETSLVTTSIGNVVVYDVEVDSNTTEYGGIAPGSEVTSTVSCPTGKVALGGGGETNTYWFSMTCSKPTSFNGDGLATEWEVKFRNNSPDTYNNLPITTWVISARVAHV